MWYRNIVTVYLLVIFFYFLFASYPQSVLRCDDATVGDGGLHVLGNGDDFRYRLVS